MSNFPKLLSSQYVFDMAKAILDGFRKGYRVFRDISIQIKEFFESQDLKDIQELINSRINYHDDRVRENVIALEKEFDLMTLNSDIRKKVKLYYVRSLTNHRQPEIAVTFFNSIITRFLNNSFFHNDFNFVRLTISTENNEIRTKPTYQAHYPKDHSNFFKPSTWLYFQNLLKDGHASDYFGYQERIRFNSR